MGEKGGVRVCGSGGKGLSEDSGIKFRNLRIKNINNLLAYG
jgi:hypothetical protein